MTAILHGGFLLKTAFCSVDNNRTKYSLLRSGEIILYYDQYWLTCRLPRYQAFMTFLGSSMGVGNVSGWSAERGASRPAKRPESATARLVGRWAARSLQNKKIYKPMCG